ncbi:MAG TPA: bifunctional UDP-N-acetylglucosamine diphosphorylase/glucosamine-1-phosphate N-acetyltransferase GlmU [Candidatus Binataceae bacterium]|nr:bifunctional UDP-N-acetylglucosamine diphosphorylase/glucosamine-1-phosphate N-acetyltransferase GlmU [Candidatus Binataceae bacterium]
MNRDRPLAAIVMAAGFGTRMRSAYPKVLHPIGGRPMIVRVLEAISGLGSGFSIVVLGHGAALVEAEIIARLDSDAVRFAIQHSPQGTGDAARCGMRMLPADFAGDVLLVYGDMPRLSPATLARFVTSHRDHGAPLSIISTRLDSPGRYGRIVRDSAGAVSAIVEAADATPAQLAIDEINTGVYLADAAVLRGALEELRPDNAQGEYYLTDIVAAVRRRDLKIQAWVAEHPAEFAGVNSREELAEMESDIRRETNRRLMAAGVTMIDPATAYISEEAEIGRDCVIGPNVQILGHCRIGAGVRIEGTAFLSEVSIGDRSHLKLGVRAEQCRIGEDCEIGPFANLRAGTDLEGHNRIGNFVETKQARIGRGSKASHLSYLGDAVIGRDTNLGCGVITVNYDGYDKHRTEIGDRCMIGCDTQMVAPVKVGSDVYVASGTTILRDVPDGALCVSRHPQAVKPGWTESWRKRHRKPGGDGKTAPAREGRE